MKNLSKRKKILLIVLAVLALLCALAFAGFYYVFGGLKRVNIDKSPEALGIDNSINQEYPGRDVVNIAIFGLDGRDLSVDEGRSDSLMILSIDKNKNCIKLSSILRDSYVAIDGHGHEKICHAYSYGGPELAIKTLNQNFKLNIKDYVTANFAQFANIVDSMGGVDLNISQKEMNEINRMSAETSSTPLSSYGLVHLNGTQALHYSRIRYIDNDEVRAERQRTVLEALYNKANKSSIDSVGFVKNIMPMLETSLGYTDIIGFAQHFMGSHANLKQISIPDTSKATGGNYEGAWVWRYDLNAESNRLKKFIYEE